MDLRTLIGIFENSESKNIDVWCGGRLAAQFKRKATKVKNEGNGTISVKEIGGKATSYIDANHVSNVWVSGGSKEDSVFI